jgi:hypothetical protein
MAGSVPHTDLIEHPCPVCQKPSRSCGHTPADKREFFQQTRELRKIAKAVLDAQTPKPKGFHQVKPEGPAVFREREGDQGLLKVKAGDKWLKMRSTAPEHPCRDLTNEYGQ